MSINVHLENAIAFDEPGFLGGSVPQHGADMLQWRVQIAVDAPQLAFLRSLALSH